MDLISSLLILLVAGRLLGRLFKALGYLPIMGEILGGLLIGPSVFNLVQPTESLYGIVKLGIFLLIFEAGLKVDLKDILASLKSKAIVWGALSFAVSMAGGAAFGMVFSLPVSASVIIGLCFSITSIPVALNFLNNAKISKTPLGHAVIGVAVAIEIACLLVFGMFSDIAHESGFLAIAKAASLKIALLLLFFFAVMMVNTFLRSEIYHIRRTQTFFRRLIHYIGDEAIFGMGVIFVLLFSAGAELLGFHFVIGAFFGGLLLNQDIIKTDAFNSLSRTLTSITNHFLTPIFFAYLGLMLQFDSFQNGFLIAALLAAGYAAKISGSFFGGRLAGFASKPALQGAVILNSRGTLDLIVAKLAFDAQYIERQILDILILFGVFSVLLNPVIYRRVSAAHFLSPRKAAPPGGS